MEDCTIVLYVPSGSAKVYEHVQIIPLDIQGRSIPAICFKTPKGEEIQAHGIPFLVIKNE